MMTAVGEVGAAWMGGGSAERAVVERLRRGEAAAVQALVDAHWEALVRYAVRLLGTVDGAEDAAQRAFVRLWEHRARWRPDTNARALLFRLTRNFALNAMESEEARRRWRWDPRLERGAPPTPAELLAERDLAAAVERAVASLSPRRREALSLARYERLTHAEIAEVMGVSVRTVANHITAALDQLEEALGDDLE